MTTAAETAATLRAKITTDLAAIEAAMAELAVKGLTLAEQPHVLLATCGMVVNHDGLNRLRLWGTASDLSNAFSGDRSPVSIAGLKWNMALTEEQRKSACDVLAVPLETALIRCASDKRELLAVLDAAGC